MSLILCRLNMVRGNIVICYKTAAKQQSQYNKAWQSIVFTIVDNISFNILNECVCVSEIEREREKNGRRVNMYRFSFSVWSLSSWPNVEEEKNRFHLVHSTHLCSLLLWMCVSARAHTHSSRSFSLLRLFYGRIVEMVEKLKALAVLCSAIPLSLQVADLEMMQAEAHTLYQHAKQQYQQSAGRFCVFAIEEKKKKNVSFFLCRLFIVKSFHFI